MSYYFVALTATILIPLAIGAFYFKILSKPVRIFFVFIVAGTIVEILLIIFLLLKLPNLYMIHFYTMVELLLLSFFFYHIIKAEAWKKYIVSGVFVLAVFLVVYAFWGNNFYSFNSIPRAIENIFILSLANRLFYERFMLNITEDPLRSGVFYLNGGILIYFASSFIIFAFSKYLESRDHLILIYNIHAFINAFCNLIFAFGIWMSVRQYFTTIR